MPEGLKFDPAKMGPVEPLKYDPESMGEIEPLKPQELPTSMTEDIITSIPKLPEAASEFSMSIPVLGEIAKKAGMGTAAVASYLTQQAMGKDKTLGDIYSEIEQMEAQRAGKFQEENPVLATGAKLAGSAYMPGVGLAGKGATAIGSRIVGESALSAADSLVREGVVEAEEAAKTTGGFVAAIEGLLAGGRVGRRLFTQFMAGVNPETVKKYVERVDFINEADLEKVKDAIDEVAEGKRIAVSKAKEKEAFAKESYRSAAQSTRESAKRAREEAKEAVAKANNDLKKARDDLTFAIKQKGVTPETVDKISEAMVQIRKKTSQASTHAFKILEKKGQSIDMQPARDFLEAQLDLYRVGGKLTDEEGVSKIQKLIKMIDDTPRARMQTPKEKFDFIEEFGSTGTRPFTLEKGSSGDLFVNTVENGRFKVNDVLEYMDDKLPWEINRYNEALDAGDEVAELEALNEIFYDFITEHDEDLIEQLKYKAPKDATAGLTPTKEKGGLRLFEGKAEKLAKSPDEAGYVIDEDLSEGNIQLWNDPADPFDVYLIDKEKGLVFGADDLERWAKDLEWEDSQGFPVRKYVDEGREQLPLDTEKSFEDMPRLKQLYKEIYDDIQTYEHPADIIKIASDMPGVSVPRKGFGKETRLPATDVKRFIQYLDRLTDKAYYEAAKAGKYRDLGDRAVVGLRRFLDSDLKAIPEYKDAMKDLAWTTEVLDQAGELFSYDSGKKIASRINRLLGDVAKGDEFATQDYERLTDLAEQVPEADFMQDLGAIQREKQLIATPEGRRTLMEGTPAAEELARQQARLKEAEAYLRPEKLQEVLEGLPEASALRQSMTQTRAAEAELEPIKRLTKDRTQSIIQGQISRKKPNIEDRRALESLQKSDMPGLMQDIEDVGIKELFDKPYARGSRNVNWGAISLSSLLSFASEKFGRDAGLFLGSGLGAFADVLGPQSVKKVLDFEIALQRGQHPKLKWAMDAIKEAITRGPRAYTLTMQNLLSTNEDFRKAMGYKDSSNQPKSNVPSPQLGVGMGEAAQRGENGVNAEHYKRMQSDPEYRKKVTRQQK